jgi:hypothetical protein
MVLTKMLSVKKSQNEVEEIADPVISDSLDDHQNPLITKM